MPVKRSTSTSSPPASMAQTPTQSSYQASPTGGARRPTTSEAATAASPPGTTAAPLAPGQAPSAFHPHWDQLDSSKPALQESSATAVFKSPTETAQLNSRRKSVYKSRSLETIPKEAVSKEAVSKEAVSKKAVAQLALVGHDVQGVHDAIALERLGYGDAIAEGAIGDVKKGGITAAAPLHDVMFNSSWKVAFESALAAVFVRNKAFFRGNVLRTLAELEPIVLGSLRAKTTATDKALFKCFQGDANAVQAYTIRKEKAGNGPITYPIVVNPAVKTIPEDEVVPYYEQVFREENYENFFEEQLTAIYNFGDFVSRPHKFSSEKLEPRALEFTGGSHSTKGLINQMMEDWARYKLAERPGWFDPVKTGNPSVSRQERQHTGPGHSLSVHNNYSGSYGGIWAVQGNRSTDVSNPYLAHVEDLLIPPFFNTTGVGLWRPMDKTKNAMDEASIAMHRLDTPMIGGISGGMGTYLITLKSAGGNVTEEDLLKSFFTAYSVMISKGYHSLHEVAVVGESLGLPYRGGDYLSLLPDEWIAQIPDLKELVGRFEELLQENRSRSKRNVTTSGHYRSEANPPTGHPVPLGRSRTVG